MIYHFRVHKEDDNGYWAECVELKGCITEADTFDNLLENMKEVLELYLDEPEESSLDIPLPNESPKGRGIIGVRVSPNIALAFMLRLLRRKHKMTQKEVANAMGFKGIYNYQRLESSKTANPELSTLDRIKSAFPEFSIDFIVQGSFQKMTHVYPIEGEWIVIEEKSNKVNSIHSKKENAVRVARDVARKTDGAITIHENERRRNGIPRIRKATDGRTIRNKG